MISHKFPVSSDRNIPKGRYIAFMQLLYYFPKPIGIQGGESYAHLRIVGGISLVRDGEYQGVIQVHFFTELGIFHRTCFREFFWKVDQGTVNPIVIIAKMP